MKKEYFFCYDQRLADFLRYEKNIEYITKARSVKNNFIFYLFEKSDLLQTAIDEWLKKGVQ
ncbi:hypothetical protein GGR02_003024 [Anoxybacillus voinovskiensis]|uniref:DUF5659 domain-containing protein n=1 Tax=Anoxybacteroides voinovskiense TaxID=230470 RepID=A0A840DXI8_9BACL|nr:hypothetical protein [Anoxybacillus voinovskiensis]MBB4075207.1 hypothetical protein [Anoxybacillus voinovskiensis]GGJ77136.1 hypothetical protein GCM10008982_28120 [Anoxybacillus voinovskiensis]